MTTYRLRTAWSSHQPCNCNGAAHGWRPAGCPHPNGKIVMGSVPEMPALTATLTGAWPALCCMVRGKNAAGAQAIPLPDAGELTREPGPLPKAAARTSVYFEVSSRSDSGRCCTVTGSSALGPKQMSRLDTLNTKGKGWCPLTKASSIMGRALPAPPSQSFCVKCSHDDGETSVLWGLLACTSLRQELRWQCM